MKNKNVVIFIVLTILFSFLGFGGLYLLGYEFFEIFRNPVVLGLFILGGLVPGIIGIKLSGLNINEDFTNIKSLTLVFIILFLLANFMLFGIFGGINQIGNILVVLFSIVICALTFGLQEAGWIDLVYEYFLPKRGMFRAMAIIGLFKSITILPLIFIVGFPILAYSFAFFAVYLIGTSAQAVFLRKYSGSAVISMIFTGLLYGIMVFMNINLEVRLLLIGLILGIIVYALQDLMKEK